MNGREDIPAHRNDVAVVRILQSAAKRFQGAVLANKTTQGHRRTLASVPGRLRNPGHVLIIDAHRPGH